MHMHMRMLRWMLLVSLSLAASFTAPSSRTPPGRARRSIAPRCCTGAADLEAIVQACLGGPTAALPPEAKERVEAYVRELLRYNERTNVYSKSAYEHLPFHVQDSVVLAEHLASQQPSVGGKPKPQPKPKPKPKPKPRPKPRPKPKPTPMPTPKPKRKPKPEPIPNANQVAASSTWAPARVCLQVMTTNHP